MSVLRRKFILLFLIIIIVFAKSLVDKITNNILIEKNLIEKSVFFYEIFSIKLGLFFIEFLISLKEDNLKKDVSRKFIYIFLKNFYIFASLKTLKLFVMSDSNKVVKRYSDEELNEFREIIEEKLVQARENLAMLLEAFSNDANDLGDTSPTFKVLEEGSSVYSKEENANMAARQQKFIKDLEAALIRIENKTYGVCRVTGELIPKERLRLVPHATLTVEAKNQQAKKK